MLDLVDDLDHRPLGTGFADAVQVRWA